MSLKIIGAIVVIILNGIAFLIARTTGMKKKIEEIEQVEEELDVNVNKDAEE